MKIHQSITSERLMEAIQENEQSLSNVGFCVECGEEADGVEPDAQGYECSSCGAHAVYGAEELLLMTAGW